MSSDKSQYRHFYYKRKHHEIEYNICEVLLVYVSGFFVVYIFGFLLRRSLEVANTAETFEEVLHRSPGFGNPSLVEYLAEKLGISESNPPSLLRSLQM